MYFDTLMPTLLMIVETQIDKDLRVLRGKAMECLSIVGACVPVERFQYVRVGLWRGESRGCEDICCCFFYLQPFLTRL
jgi:hypothetical protein